MQIPMRCTCGSFRAVVETNRKPDRFVCMCDDCQAFAHYLERPDVLDANGGSDIIPIMPREMRILEGKFEGVRLDHKGMYRWFSTCCRTPIGNSPGGSMPYIGTPSVVYENPERLFGPVLAYVQTKFGIPPLPPNAGKGMSWRAIWLMLSFMVPAYLTKGPSPFFDKEGRPLVEPKILSRSEREALRKFCGPSPQA